MADAPWRCSQCGTVNEPVANACRTCGRWPSLFDIEATTISDEDVPMESDDDPFAAQSVEVEQFEPETFEPEDVPGEMSLPPELDAEEDGTATAPKPLWQRLASLIVPVAVVLYVLISALANR